MRVTESNFQEVVALLSATDKLAVDCETSGLDWDDRAFLIQIADNTSEYIFPQELFNLAEFKNIFNSNKHWILKNAKFDMRMLHWLGINLNGVIEDVGIKARIHKNDFYGERAYSLDSLAHRYLGKRKDKTLDAYLKEKNLYRKKVTKTGEEYSVPCFYLVPQEILDRYAGLDARLTYDLSVRLDELMDDTDKRVHKMECMLIPYVFDMEMRGVRVDLDYCKKAWKEEEMLMIRATQDFLMKTGVPYSNSKTVLLPVFKNAGEKMHYTESGNPSLTDDVLESYSSPAAKCVQKYKYHEKRISTFYKNFIDKADDNGYLHPSLWQEGTRTRRFSCSNPNLQQLPKKEEGFEIRKCITADPGHILVSMDFSQMEYKLMISYANETRVIKQLAAGVDFHQAIADAVGIDRDSAKTLNFAILYGAGDDKIAQMLGIEKAKARIMRTKYYLALPRVEKFKNDIEREGKTRGYVKNWTGFKCRADADFVYALPNHIIQSGCAEVAKIAMLRCGSLLQGTQSRMIASIHDQIVFSVHPEDLRLVPHLEHAMNTVFPETNGVTLKVDVEWSSGSLAKSDLKKGLPDAQQLAAI